jgi:hypothetical protein
MDEKFYEEWLAEWLADHRGDEFFNKWLGDFIDGWSDEFCIPKEFLEKTILDLWKKYFDKNLEPPICLLKTRSKKNG